MPLLALLLLVYGPDTRSLASEDWPTREAAERSLSASLPLSLPALLTRPADPEASRRRDAILHPYAVTLDILPYRLSALRLLYYPDADDGRWLRCHAWESERLQGELIVYALRHGLLTQQEVDYAFASIWWRGGRLEGMVRDARRRVEWR